MSRQSELESLLRHRIVDMIGVVAQKRPDLAQRLREAHTLVEVDWVRAQQVMGQAASELRVLLDTELVAMTNDLTATAVNPNPTTSLSLRGGMVSRWLNTASRKMKALLGTRGMRDTGPPQLVKDQYAALMYRLGHPPIDVCPYFQYGVSGPFIGVFVGITIDTSTCTARDVAVFWTPPLYAAEGIVFGNVTEALKNRPILLGAPGDLVIVLIGGVNLTKAVILAALDLFIQDENPSGSNIVRVQESLDLFPCAFTYVLQGYMTAHAKSTIRLTLGLDAKTAFVVP